MVLDHANKFLYGEALPVIFQVGRIVMPIFAFVLPIILRGRAPTSAVFIHG